MTGDQEGLSRWREYPNIRLVITDLAMPVTDGVEVIRTIRAEESHCTYLIVLSSLEDRESLIQALELGTDDYLAKKPISPEEPNLRLMHGGRLIRLDSMDDLVFGLANCPDTEAARQAGICAEPSNFARLWAVTCWLNIPN